MRGFRGMGLFLCSLLLFEEYSICFIILLLSPDPLDSKQSFKDLVFTTTQSLEDGLREFRFFYNHIRLHQNLDYNTPANAWKGKPMPTSKTAR